MALAIAGCEVAFWLVLTLGLLLRYGLLLRRASAIVLRCVPLVDLALLAFTAVDLHRGAKPELGHGLAAVYLGFSVAFGPGVISWADRRIAHRVGGAPRPVKPAAGTPERVRKEWRDWGLAVLGFAPGQAERRDGHRGGGGRVRTTPGSARLLLMLRPPLGSTDNL